MSKKKLRRPVSAPKKSTIPPPMNASQKKKLLIVCCSLLSILVLIGAWYYLIYDDGSLRVSHSAIQDKQDSWLIVDRGRGKNSPYYHIANLAIPAGYHTVDDGLGTLLTTSSGVDLSTYFTFVPDDESNALEEIIVYPCAKPLDEMVSDAYESYRLRADAPMDSVPAGVISPIETAQSALGEGKRFYCDFAYYSDAAGKVNFAQTMLTYLPARYSDCCILVITTAFPESAEAYLSPDWMLAETEKAITAISCVDTE